MFSIEGINIVFGSTGSASNTGATRGGRGGIVTR